MTLVKGFFITGTGTGVGKTMLASAVTAYLSLRGTTVPMKPVQTGAIREHGALRAPDLDFVLRSAGLNLSAAEYSLASPYRFTTPCSPHLAARLARRPIRLSRIMECARKLAARYEYIVAEGAGGILVPLASDRFMLDVICRFSLPALIVAPATLGTLNHSLLTFRLLKQARLPVAGICLWANKWGLVEKNNMKTIEAITHTRVIRFPFFRAPKDGCLSARDLRSAMRVLGPALECFLQPMR